MPRSLWLIALILFVCAVYVLFVSAWVSPWPLYGVFHDLQADGFLRGQLSLPAQPAPEVLAAKDPYNYAYVDYWLLDASYYRRKYYMYWGPVPALLQAAGKRLLHVDKQVGDQYLMLFFLCFAAVFGAALIGRVARRLFPGLPRTLTAVAVLAFAFANPTLHAASTASTYHTAIIAGQAWLVGGVVFAFDVVWHAGTRSARSSRLLLAGGCWALAIASRVTLLPAVALLIGITASLDAAAPVARFGRFLAASVWLGAPVALVGLALLGYNQLRFDDWLEFGSNIQLSGFPRLRFSNAFVPLNLYAYSLRPWLASCQFPFLFQEWNPSHPFPHRFLPLPRGYLSPEPVVGFLLAVPLTWLAPFALVLAPRRHVLANRRARAYWFCLLTFMVLASVTGVIALGVYGATMRYLSDITYGLVLLAVLAGFALRSHPLAQHAPRVVSGLVGGLGIGTVAIGVLLGYQGYNGHFHRFNPGLDRALTGALSFCGGRAAVLPEWMHDPANTPPGSEQMVR